MRTNRFFRPEIRATSRLADENHSIRFALLCLCAPLSQAAVPRDFAVDLKATVSDVAPHIVLSWTQRVQSNITAQKIHRRLKGSATWVKLADLTTTQTSFTDSTALPAVEYEYWMERNLTGLAPNVAMGYLSAGVKVPEVHTRGKLLLVVDDTMVTPLAGEIDQLKLDLAADGWTVQTITAPRTATAIATKALITAAYNADPANVKAVYLLGHVRVPYSGNIFPDGHSPDHVGAWPADGYYGDMDGIWTDTMANNTGASRPQNDNIPGDGKFDQASFPSLIELQVGRVDLHTMTKAPSSGVSEASRLGRYLKRAQEFRHELGAYSNIPRRTLIRDSFGHAFSSEPFAVAAWAGAFSSVGPAIDSAPSYKWFSATYAGGKDYLLGHGCGGGSYESAAGLGTSTDFGIKPSRVVFTSVFGSYHGDWDADNNLMRAVITGNANGDSLGLTCFWTGRPHWFTHHPGMGETVGHMTKISMNSGLTGGGGYLPSSSSFRGVHIGLMGDPALRMHVVEPPRALAATSSNGQVDLTWAVSTESAVQGYHVYRADSPSGDFVKLTAAPVVGTAFADPTVTPAQSYTYLVRTLKLETVPGGSYYNLSIGSAVRITANSGAIPAPENPSELTAAKPPTGGGALLAWRDNSSTETGFRIERKTNFAGSWSSLATIAADTTTHTDPGPLVPGNIYFYRVIATGGAGDSTSSNETGFEPPAGFVEFAASRTKVDKSAGTVTLGAVRSKGASGAVSVTCTPSNLTAIGNTHYTSGPKVITWADGEDGLKETTIPIINTATPQLPRQFRVTLSGASNGLALGTAITSSVQIEDASATLAAPWTSTILGTVQDHSPAVSAEGVIGDSILGGGGAAASSTSDSGRFIHQSRTGNGMLTIQVPAPTIAQTTARFAVMVRASTAGNAVMASTITASSSANYGTRFIHRGASGGGASDPIGADNNLDAPRWLRLIRFGNEFISQASADGAVWTSLGSTTLSSMPATAVWGIFHLSANVSTTTGLGDFHLATYQNVSLTDLPPAAAPTAFTATPGSGIALAWTDSSFNETGFQIERQAANGAWSPLHSTAANVVAFTDTTPLPGVLYQYRVKAVAVTGDSAWVSASATAPGTATGYQQWLLANNLPMDATGTGNATATPANDQLPNLVKYALGLPANSNGHLGRLDSRMTGDLLEFAFIRPDPIPADLIYNVEASPSLGDGTWTTDFIVPVSSITADGRTTVTVRLEPPPGDGEKYFLRLKVTQR